MLEKDIKILLKNKKKRCQYYLERKRLPDYRNYSLKHKKYLSGLFKYPRTIRLVLRINAWSVKEFLKFFMGLKILLLKFFRILSSILPQVTPFLTTHHIQDFPFGWVRHLPSSVNVAFRATTIPITFTADVSVAFRATLNLEGTMLPFSCQK